MLRLFIILVSVFAFSKVAFAADTTTTTEAAKKAETTEVSSTTDVNSTADKKEEDATASTKAAK